MGVKTILFDVGGTLLRVRPSVGSVYAATAREHGVESTPATLDANFRAAWRESLTRRKSRDFVCSDEILREEWYRIVCDTFGETVPPDRMSTLFDDLYERFATANAWEVAPRARETLAFLKERSVRLGVLSNWDSRLETTLRELGLDELFDFIIVSYAVGVEKPHRNIFLTALEAAGTAPEETLIVGDSFDADIVPARELGLSAVWVASESQPADRADVPNFIMEHFPETPETFWTRWIG